MEEKPKGEKMVDHWIVEADGLEARYHTLASNPDQAVTNWFEDLEDEEINMSAGLFVYDADETEEYIMSIAFAAIRRKLISNKTFYKVLNDIGLDIDSPTYELLKANKGTEGLFRQTKNGFFRKPSEEEWNGEEDGNDW